jgi:hypothetical protein
MSASNAKRNSTENDVSVEKAIDDEERSGDVAHTVLVNNIQAK